MADDKKSWLDEFVDLMGGARDTVRSIEETIEILTGKNDPSPTAIPRLEDKEVQGESTLPRTGGLSDSWLLVAALVVVVVLVVK